MTWNYNMDEAPKGYYQDTGKKTKKGETIQEFVKEYVIVVTKCGGWVYKSYWIEDQNRWNFFNGKIDKKPVHEPVGWTHFEEPNP